MTDDLDEVVRSNAARLLTASGITQERFGLSLGRSQPYVSRRLSGEVAFSLADVDDWAELLGVDRLELLIEAGV